MHKDFDKALGAALREARKEKGLSQQDVAEKLNVSKMAVSHWEKGDRSMTALNLIKYCKAIGISIDTALDQT